MCEQILTQAEAAKYLGVAPLTMRNWRNQRRGPDYLKIGRAISFCKSDLDRFIERSRVRLPVNTDGKAP